MFDSNDGYVNKTKSLSLEIARIKGKYGLEKIYRFDLGENVDGYSPNILDYLNRIKNNNKFVNELNEYPDITHRVFREEIARLHGIIRDQIVISTGLDSILDLISRVFFDYKDTYLMPIPDFFLFENYSERMGAIPLFLPLKEKNNFEWNQHTIESYNDLITRFRPKLVWVSNPCNPTGKLIPINIILNLIHIAAKNNVFIVIDEAYAEYIKGNDHTAVQFINKYKNLMVLRTFSKAYGLAGIRLGYLMSSSRDIINALLMHRQYFPATKMAITMASIAMRDQQFIEQSIDNIDSRKKILFDQLNHLKTFEYIDSDTNIFILRNKFLSDLKLKSIFKRYGIFTSHALNENNRNAYYLRITIKNETDNEYFFRVCTLIEKEIIQSANYQNFDFSYS